MKKYSLKRVLVFNIFPSIFREQLTSYNFDYIEAVGKNSHENR